MSASYFDSSVLVGLYWRDRNSERAARLVVQERQPIVFTAFHALEINTAARQKVFRGEMTRAQLLNGFERMTQDQLAGVLAWQEIAWPLAFSCAEDCGRERAEKEKIRALDLFHLGICVSLGRKRFLTLDERQGRVALACGLESEGWLQ